MHKEISAIMGQRHLFSYVYYCEAKTLKVTCHVTLFNVFFPPFARRPVRKCHVIGRKFKVAWPFLLYC